MTHTPKHEATDAMGMSNANAQNPLSGKSGELKPCEYCGPDIRTGLPGNACENCMGTGVARPPEPEEEAWAWVQSRYPKDHISDLAFDADEMVDAFIAGRATTQPAEQGVAEERGAFRTALEMIASGKFDPIETAMAALNDLDAGLLALAEQSASSPVEGEAELRKAAEAVAKIAPGLWGSDIEKGEGSYGEGDEDRTGFMVPYMETEHGKRLFDAHHCDVAEIHEDYDEDGVYAWDENARLIFNYLAMVQPSKIIAMLDSLATRSVAVSSAAVKFTHEHMREMFTDEQIRNLLDAKDVGTGRARLAALFNQARKPEGAEPVGCAEVEVGRAVYERIEALMVRKPVPQSSDAAELDYLSHLAESVEEVGGYDGPLRPLVRTPMDREAVAAFLKERDQSVEAYEASDEERLESAEAILGLVPAHPAHEAGEVERLSSALTDLVSWFDKPVQGVNGLVWVIRAGEQGADDAVTEARAALEDK